VKVHLPLHELPPNSFPLNDPQYENLLGFFKLKSWRGRRPRNVSPPSFSPLSYSKYLASSGQLSRTSQRPTYVPDFRGEWVTSAAEIREIAIRHGRAKKRNNAIVAILSGAVPGVVLSHYVLPDWKGWFAGLVVGLLWRKQPAGNPARYEETHQTCNPA